LASNLVAIFDEGLVKVPKSSKEIEAMVEELLNY
jgi:phage terminase large subunit-like protein